MSKEITSDDWLLKTIASIAKSLKEKMESEKFSYQFSYLFNKDDIFAENKKDFFIQVKTGDGRIIGNKKCHYEFYFDKEEKKMFPMIHFEGDSKKYEPVIKRLLDVCSKKEELKELSNNKGRWFYIDGSEMNIGDYKDNSDSFCDKAIEKMRDLDNKIKKEIKRMRSKDNLEPYVNKLRKVTNLILTGAPGTGKTYMAKDIAAMIVSGDKTYEDIEKDDKLKDLKEQIGFVQFHPSYDYTDFIEGLRPVNDKDNGNQIAFKRTDGIFKEFCKKALSSTDTRKYVFIIDEINRGEVSKIFGELFYCIEPGYRGEKGRIKTQYQNLVDIGDEFKEGFYVPKNVYIIGTMNDIDRSVESMDFAFRRRFAWEEIKASDTQNMLDGNIDDLSKLEDAKKKMNSLNDAIWNEYTKEGIEGLSSAYHIGASYFFQLKTYKDDADKGFESLWKYHIKPLLQEYLRGMDDVDEKLEILKKAYNVKASSGESSNT